MQSHSRKAKKRGYVEGNRTERRWEKRRVMEECEMRVMRKTELKGAIGEASLTGPQQDWGRHVKLGDD